MQAVEIEPAVEKLAAALGARARRRVLLARYTSMRVGGPADLLMVCRTTQELVEAVELARVHGVPWRVLGGGCNVLVADAGVRGLVLINRADGIQFSDGGTVRAEAGAPFGAVARQAAERGLAGLEWAAGLPGTVGGAVVGNAGAFGGDVASALQQATVLDPNGTVVERSNEWFAFGYRTSRLKTSTGAQAVVLGAVFRLQPGDPDDLRQRIADILAWRRRRHPAGATMGSTFKNPPHDHAGRLIEEAGLKGFQLGGVRVSERHANFLINEGGASAADVLAVIRHIQAEVRRRFGVELELEIELVGDW